MSEAAKHPAATGADELGFTVHLVLAARRWRTLLDEKLREIGQSSARMEALSAIRHSTAGCAQVDIARRLRIEGPTLTRMIAALERDGLVARRPDGADRRTKRLSLTDEGERTLDAILALAGATRSRLLAGIASEDLAGADRLLAGLLDRLDGGLPGDDG